MGTAVQRNRIKRLLREAFRLGRDQYPDNGDVVVVVKRGQDFRRLKLADVQKDLYNALRRIRREAAMANLDTPPSEPQHFGENLPDEFPTMIPHPSPCVVR